jgi:hypothetical protein
MARGTACDSRGASAGRCRCQLMPQRAPTNDSTSPRIATSEWSGGRRKVCGMRELGPATHSRPFLERRSAPFFHEDVTPPSSMRPQPVRRAGFGWRSEERRSEESEALGCVDPCCGVQAQSLLPPSSLRKSEAAWLWWPGRDRCHRRCRCRCRCLSLSFSLISRLWTLQR